MEVDSGTKLLGLRDDGDWILDAMYIDHARMRNRLSTDLWIDMNKVPYLSKEPRAINGTRGYFVEVFLNNSYLGLYCLTERIDRKQLQLSKKRVSLIKPAIGAVPQNLSMAMPRSTTILTIGTVGNWNTRPKPRPLPYPR